MANALKEEKRKIATATQRNRQDERFARKVSSDFDAKVVAMEEKMKEQDINSAGLVATLDDVIANNSRLVDSVLLLMDGVKLKEAPNSTKAKLRRLEEKYGKNSRSR